MNCARKGIVNDMKVGDIPGGAPGSVSPGRISSLASEAYGQHTRSAYGGASDQVTLSSGSRAATAALSSHSSRLAELRSLVTGNQYNPSADAIGQAVLAGVLTPNADVGGAN